MNIIKCIIRGQNLSVLVPTMASLTVRYFNLIASFSSEWAGAQKWVHIHRKDSPSVGSDWMLDENDAVNSDQMLHLGAGEWEIWFHGTINFPGSQYEMRRITTVKQYFTVQETGGDGGILPPIEHSVAEQIAAIAQEALDVANSVQDRANAGEFAGPTGPQGPEGPEGPQGPQGKPGTGFEIVATVDSVENLPTGVNPGTAYGVGTEPPYNVWISDGVSWTNYGPIQGPVGPQGPQGEQGPEGPQGSGFVISGYVDSIDDLPPTVGAGTNYAVGTVTPYDIYTFDGLIWHNNGPIQGPAGPQGEQGPVGPQGPEGPQGPVGPQGPPGEGGGDSKIKLYTTNSDGVTADATTINNHVRVDRGAAILSYNGSNYFYYGQYEGNNSKCLWYRLYAYPSQNKIHILAQENKTITASYIDVVKIENSIISNSDNPVSSRALYNKYEADNAKSYQGFTPSVSYSSNNSEMQKCGNIVTCYFSFNLTGEISKDVWTTIGEIPAGFRPYRMARFAGNVANTRLCQVRVTTAGAVQIASGVANAEGETLQVRCDATWILA